MKQDGQASQIMQKIQKNQYQCAKKRRKIKFSIAKRLMLCFTAALFFLTVLIGSVFTVFYRNYTENMHRDNMKKTARSIATVLTSAIQGGSESLWDVFIDSDTRYGGPFSGPGYPNYGGNSGVVYLDGATLISFVKELTDADVWLIDSSLNIITTSQETESEASGSYDYADLPFAAQKFIRKIFEDAGYEVFGEGFSDVIGTEMVSVGMPIYSPGGEVIGAVLMHTPTGSMTREINTGLLILLGSLAFALFVGMIISIIFSNTLAKPLKRITNTALMLSEGDYSALTHVNRHDEIGELARTMDEMGGKLQLAEQESMKLQKMRQDFVANISHELRTPVTVIRGSLEALCDGVVSNPERVDEYHKQLLGESIYMQRLVNDILDLSRLQNPDFSIDMSDFNLHDCVSDAVRSGRKIAADKGRTIDFTYDSVMYTAKGDYDRIRQMLLIIIDNAVKFTDDPANHINVELKNDTVSISNIGPGIKEEELPLIFERFYKSRSEQNKNGTGLGLAIAKQIASRHSVSVSVSSMQGGVTTFRFVFPADNSDAHAPQP